MITIRNKKGLDDKMIPYLDHFINECDTIGLEVLIHSTKRTFEEQAILYRNGRSYSVIREKAHELENIYGRKDLADILINVGPQYGKIIRTNAGPGQSMHNYGLAFDGVPIWQGKIIYDNDNTIPDPIEDKLWNEYGRCAVAAGLVWAGNWIRFKEMPHCQYPGIGWRELIRNV